jgi:hypothetical protein
MYDLWSVNNYFFIFFISRFNLIRTKLSENITKYLVGHDKNTKKVRPRVLFPHNNKIFLRIR